jgi:hypothetical protein
MSHARPLVAIALFCAVLAAAAASAAVITVTDCAGDPHVVANPGTRTTYLQVGSDDLVLHCTLVPLPGTDRLVVAGHDITIENPGSVLAAGSAANAITATGTLTATDTTLASSGSNGQLKIVAVHDITLTRATLAVGDATHDGDALMVSCTGTAPNCTISAITSTLECRHVEIEAQGDVVFSASKILTTSPTDLVTIRSDLGNVLLGTSSGAPTGTDCCTAGKERDGNSVISGSEGNLYILAFGRIDLSGIDVVVSEFICGRSGVDDVGALSAGDACGACPGSGAAASVAADIDLSNATIRNDTGKRGEIVFCADETRAAIDLDHVVLIDDDVSSTPDLAELNGCETKPRSGCPHVVGTADTDG